MKRVIGLAVVMAVSVGTTGCAPMLAAGMFAHPRQARGGPAPAMPPIGRWDQVMSLRPGATIAMLTADGTTRAGQFVKASVRSVAFVAESGEIELPREEIIRVDLVRALPSGHRTAKTVVTGAAQGALLAGASVAALPYLLTGNLWLPPARIWGFGAVAGGLKAGQGDAHERMPRTVYIAPMRGMN
ncbi:MAG TPA: hypothetical protein VNJ03_07480 [Vicinamibacterales bacterium]|nr:hypothetical protein [Vicinamibacterales bacterium]